MPTGEPRPSKGSDSSGEQSKNRQRRQASRQPVESPGVVAARRAEKPGPESAKVELAEAKTNQKAIADELQKMLDGLSEFETYRGVVKDAQELLKQHEQAMKQTAEAADKPEMIGKPLEALSPEQKAELGNLASRQSSGRQGVAEPAGADGRDGRPDG